MQSLFYNKLQPKLGAGNIATIMSDTDSYMFVTNRGDEDTVMELLGEAGIMDFSNYPRDHPLFDESNRKRPGLLKSELPNQIIDEAVALKSKTYTIRVRKKHERRERIMRKGVMVSKPAGKVLNTAKGVQTMTKVKIPLEAYRDCIEKMTKYQITQRSIRSYKHINKMIKSEKVAFSSFDDKRFLTCAIHSVPYASVLLKSDRCYFCEHPDKLY